MLRKKIKRITSVLLALVVSGFLGITAFAHTANIEITGENRYKAVRLTPAIYNLANSDLSDLLIQDCCGEPVPYFIYSALQATDLSKSAQPIQLINSYTKDGSFYFDYRHPLWDLEDTDVVATHIEFNTRNTGFAKAVDVFGSYDDIHWEFVQSDKLYAVKDAEKLYIALNKPQKYTHYRIRLDNNHERIEFDTVYLVNHVQTVEETHFVEALTPAFTVEHDSRETRVIIEGLKHLRLSDVTIHTDSMFKRTVRTQNGESKELFNLTFNGVSYEDTTIPLVRHVPRGDTYIITIGNGDDRPIDISGVTVRYFADELVFEAVPGETYALEFGADEIKRAPVYDIERYKDEVLHSGVDRVALGGITLEFPIMAAQRDYTLPFNVVVVAVAVLLGVVILVRLRRG